MRLQKLGHTKVKYINITKSVYTYYMWMNVEILCMMFYKDDKRELDEHFPMILIKSISFGLERFNVNYQQMSPRCGV